MQNEKAEKNSYRYFEGIAQSAGSGKKIKFICKKAFFMKAFLTAQNGSEPHKSYKRSDFTQNSTWIFSFREIRIDAENKINRQNVSKSFHYTSEFRNKVKTGTIPQGKVRNIEYESHFLYFQISFYYNNVSAEKQLKYGYPVPYAV